MRVPTVDIVIVNWNAGAQLRDCLGSIAAARHEGYALGKVVVVDNASSDGSAERLDTAGIPLQVIHNNENRGFAAACNQGGRGSVADYILFLNPDTRLYPNTLAGSVRFMEDSENRAVGISTVQLLDEDGQIARCCSRFPTPRTFAFQVLGLTRLLPRNFPSGFYLEWDHGNTREVDQVMGAYLFVRRPVFETVRGFDERFFVYFEDVDFSLRVRQAGWTSVHFAGARAFHKGRGTSDQVRAQRLFYSLRSRLLYGSKHFRLRSRLSLFAITLLLEPAARLALAAARGNAGEIAEVVKAYRLLMADTPCIFRAAFTPSVSPMPAAER